MSLRRKALNGESCYTFARFYTSRSYKLFTSCSRVIHGEQQKRRVQWEIRSIKFVKSTLFERSCSSSCSGYLLRKKRHGRSRGFAIDCSIREKNLQESFFINQRCEGGVEWRDDYFFSRASRGRWSSARSRKFSRARFHGTALCKHTGCQRQAHSRADAGGPLLAVCLLYDPCFHMIYIYG